jgi:hypothetical protein
MLLYVNLSRTHCNGLKRVTIKSENCSMLSLEEQLLKYFRYSLYPSHTLFALFKLQENM